MFDHDDIIQSHPIATLLIDRGGVIFLKTRSQFNDPVELTETEALTLAALLTRLAKELRE